MNHSYQKLGDLLLARKFITEEQLRDALEQQVTTSTRLGELLIKAGFTDENTIADCLATQYGYELVDPSQCYPSAEALKLLNFRDALGDCILPVRVDRDQIYCLVADPSNVTVTDELAIKSRKRVALGIAPERKLVSRIEQAYRGDNSAGACPVKLPARFAQAVPKHQSAGSIWFEALDSFLDRPVSIFAIQNDSPSLKSHITRIRAWAKNTHPDLGVVFDSVGFENSQLTILESLNGQQLSETMFHGKERSPEEAAQIISRVARVADFLGLNDPQWICPENIWLTRDEIRVAPLFESKSEAHPESEVEALGNLLWQCLQGHYGAKVDFSSPAVALMPSAMLMLIQRCLSKSDDRLKSPREVHDALSRFRWSGVSSTAPNDGDREELLTSLRVVSEPAKPSLWSRIFGRKAA